MQIKKILNFRPFLAIFVALIFGAVLAPKVFSSAVVLICLFCFAALLLAILCVPAKTRAAGVLMLCGLIIGFGFASISIKSLQKYGSVIYSTQIEGVATDKISASGDEVSVVLRNVKVNGKKRGGKLVASFSANLNISSGDRISFGGRISGYKIITNGKINTYMLRSGINGTAYVSGQAEVEKGKSTLFEKIRISAKNLIDSNFKSEAGRQISYSALFGDTTYLDNQFKNEFKLAGGAHLLVVSGLHVVLLVQILFFILKLFSAGRKTKFFVCSGFLLFFMFLCGFSPSVVRAGLMVFVYLLADVLGEESDALQTLCVAGAAILLVSPLSVFDAGFGLSFACVFGILCLHKQLCMFFEKLRLKKFLASSLAICISVFAATIFLSAFYFGEVQLVGIVSNIILVPLFSVYFFFLFITVALSLVFGFLAPLLFLSEQLFLIVNIFVSIFAKANTVLLNATFFMAIISFFIVFWFSGFIVVSKKTRTAFGSFLCAALALLCVLNNVAIKLNGSKIFAESSFVIVAKSETSGTLAILQTNDDYSLNNARLASHKAQLSKIDVLFVLQNCNNACKIKGTTVVCTGSIETVGEGCFTLAGGSTFESYGIKISFYDLVLKFAIIEVGNLKILCAAQIKENYEIEFLKTFGKFDVAFVEKFSASSAQNFAEFVVTNNYDERADNIYRTINTNFVFKKRGNVLKFSEQL